MRIGQRGSRWTEGLFDSSRPLRGRKRGLYEGGLRGVILVRWPGRLRAGSVSDDVWYFADVLPTFADLAGAPPPEGIDGVAQLALAAAARKRR